MINNQREPLLRVRNLLIAFNKGYKKVKAVKGVTFDVYRGETFGLVGESGSGKTTIGRAVMGIQPIKDGTIYFNDRVAFGHAPHLEKLNQIIDGHLNVMEQNQNTTTAYLDRFVEELKRISYKYLESKYYDFKTKTVQDYPDGVSRIIAEGVNLQTTNVIRNRKDPNLEFVYQSIMDNLKHLIKIIRIQTKSIKFCHSISEYIDVNPLLDEKIEFYANKTHEHVLKIKELENKIHNHVQLIRTLRREALSGQWTSIMKFLAEYRLQLKTIVECHKMICLLVAQSRYYHQFNLALTSNKGRRSKWIRECKEWLLAARTQGEAKKIKELKTLLDLLRTTAPIDETVQKSALFKDPDRMERRNLKKEMQMIFQDPAACLNDRMAIEQIIGEGLNNFPELYKNEQAIENYLAAYNEAHVNRQQLSESDVNPKDVKHFLIERLLETVGMLPEHLSRYPHEFSGGQRQRIGIARALVMRPSFIVADEPISALDVSIRAQIINLLLKFQKAYDLTYIFIAHDLSIVRFIADRIAVIYHGDIVELAKANELFLCPLHPYTKSLLSAMPLPNPDQEQKKQQFKYDPETEHHDYLIDFPRWAEIGDDHFVYANEREMRQYRIRLAKYNSCVADSKKEA